MKRTILKIFLIFLFIVSILVVYFSTVGIETDRFNNQLKNKIEQTNKNLVLDIRKIKLILNPFNFKVYAKTVGATVFFSNKPLQLEYVKLQLSLKSLIKNRIVSSNIQAATKSLPLKDLVQFIRATNKPIKSK